MRVRNTIILIICILAGLVLGRLLSTDRVVQPNLAAQERSSQAAAVAFYQAANRFLEAGESEEFKEILATNFVDHSAVGGSPNIAGLLRYLTALRRSYPDLRFSAASIAQDGALVVVALSTTASATALDAGFLADRPSSAPHNEVLRIVDGKIAERWADTNAGPQIELAATVDLPVIAGWSIESELERLTIEPGTTEEVYGASHSFLITSPASLVLELEPNDSALPPQLLTGASATPVPLDRGTAMSLEGEQVVQFPMEERILITNPGTEPISVIVANVQYRSPAVVSVEGNTISIDPTVEDIRLEPARLLPMKAVTSRTYRLYLVRVAAAPGEQLPPHREEGLEQFLVAEGSVAVEAHAGVVHVFDRDGRETLPLGSPREVVPGEGISSVDSALMSYRVAGNTPAVFWLVSLTPVTEA